MFALIVIILIDIAVVAAVLYYGTRENKAH